MKEKMGMNKRIEYFDIAKGIAILCIIAGHLGNARINQFVFTFHVPLFFLVSGYFLNDRLPLKEYAKNKAKQLMIPYVVAWAFIMPRQVHGAYQWLGTFEAAWKTVVNQVLAGLYGNGAEIHEIWIGEGFCVPTVGAIWFLPALFFALVIVRYFMQWRHCGVCIFFIALLGLTSSGAAWMPLSIQSGMVAASFVYLGMLARKYGVMEKKLPKEISVGIVALWAFCILFCGEMYLVENRFNHGILDFAGALAGSYVVLRFSKVLEEGAKWISKALLFFGRNSLIVLCVHTVELKGMPWDEILEGFLGHGVPTVIVYLVAKVAFCAVVTWVILEIRHFWRRFGRHFVKSGENKVEK